LENWLVRVWVRFPALVISRRVMIRLCARIVLYMRGRLSLGCIAGGMEVMVMSEGVHGSKFLMGHIVNAVSSDNGIF
jgi:hypothetical protein